MNPWSVVLFSATLLVAPSALCGEGNCTKLDDSSRPDCPSAIAFLNKLQTVLRNDDRNTVASLVRYPLLTSLHAKKVRIADRAQLLTHYEEIFDAGIRCSVLNATAKDLWGNWQGFTTGNGAVWFDGVIPATEKVNTNATDYWTKHPFKIVTVNNGSVTIPCKSK